jgi:predicted DNA-binding antitoxin AbrB/MazE fold protein
MLKDTTLKEGDRVAVNLCMEEVVNEMKEIDRIVATKEGSVNNNPQ